ncbi:SbcC/MukB-like Walker B domain-containing protein [Lactiplantibacillus herbarum]|uniref:SbcC/MukB-like Walker B domain-containing protein n=1 Tax=Lactiplantibacillus herbarum TaxID=1670446 RepID=UPI00064E7818|nr:SMC family ATPase [Lactiplantibacillus herbarum]
MKPVYLEMNYFGPHEHSIIDFRQLEAAPIFLISGDTGAGKSTIFDAMTFALFGSTTNDGSEGRAAKEMRSQFAPADQATQVSFYFEQGNQLYQITRTPEQFLAKKSGHGLTKKTSTAKLAVVETVGGVETESIATKPADVGPEITAILHLTADQFKKIILLPQNDFSEFLKSKTADKEKILKKIFGTQLYSNFTAKLKTEYDDASKTGSQFLTALQAEYGAATWLAEEQEQLQHVADDQKLTLLETFVTDRQTHLATATKQTDDVSLLVKKSEQETQAARELQQKFEKLTTTKASYQEEVAVPANEIEVKKHHMASLTWAQALQPTKTEIKRRQEEQTQLTANQQAGQSHVDEAKAAVQQAKIITTKLTDQADNMTLAQQRINTLATLIPRVEQVESLTTQLAKLQPTVTQLKETAQQRQKALTTLEETIAAQTITLPNVAQLQQTKDTLTQQKEHAVETMTPLDNQYQRCVKDQQVAQQQLTDLQETLQTEKIARQTAEAAFKVQKGNRQALMIAQLQQELVDGEPCVVCGSTDHSHMLATISADEAELRQSMQDVDDAQNTLAAARKTVDSTQKQIEQLKEAVENATTATDTAAHQLDTTYQQLLTTSDLSLPADYNLETLKKAFTVKITDFTTKLNQAQQLAQKIEQLKLDAQTQSQQLNETKMRLAEVQTEVKTKQADLTKISAEIGPDQLASSDLFAEKNQLSDKLKAYQDQLKKATDNEQTSHLDLFKYQTQLEDTTKQLQANQKSLETLTLNMNQALAAPDALTTEPAVLDQWITELEAGQLGNLQADLAKYRQTKQRLSDEIKQLESELHDQKQPDLTALQATLTTQQAQKDEAIRAQALAETALTSAQTSYDKVQLIIQQQGDFAKRFAELTSLYNIVTGKDGNDHKLKLETYVVQNYLQRILNYANAHFINLLSNNRYTFELADDPSDNRSDHGLDINVYDNETGNSRSSNTLSGGETFIAALSIALSLSEVVQSTANGVQIDALFVDEGFGSLDDETLDKAMQALAMIGENRMVGVISHIESMKRTIGQQVRLKKLGDGRSTIQLISK